jgi:phenylalanyl-tRNA synthetase beta chain
MKVSLKLLGSCQDSFDVSRFNVGNIDKLTDKINAQLGAVESVDNLSAKYEGAQIVRVVECEKHPNADKLHVCMIDDGGKNDKVERGENGLIQVVCGAPNVKAGLMVVWIPPGVVVPSSIGKDPLKIEAREIRGVMSNGMLASASELGLSDDHSGLLLLDDNVAIGSSFTDLYDLNDIIIDIENKMFTHRPDCFGQLGIARELAGISNQAFSSPDWYKENPGAIQTGDQKLSVSVDNQIPDLVPRFAVLAIAGITIKPSSSTVQGYLTRLGIRPINNVVDLTNLYMVITGQPLHAYDYDKVASLGNGAGAGLIIRNPSENEKITLLGGKTVSPSPKTIMIATQSQAIGVGGVMGGQETEVDNQTKNIILESATFNMYSIRRTSMELGIFTEAVTRFTKGQSPRQNLAVLYKAAGAIVEVSGGSVASEVVDNKAATSASPAVKLKVSFINDRLGSTYSADEIKRVLSNVEFEVTTAGDELSIVAPFWRTDIEIAEDIVEEVGRLNGFDNLPQVLPSRSIVAVSRDPMLSLKTQVRHILAKLGGNELLTYSFSHGDLFDKTSQDKKNAFKLQNALSPSLQYYRLSLLPSLQEKVHPNLKAGYPEFAIFEINPVHSRLVMEEGGELPVEDQRLGFIFAADNKTSKTKHQGASFYQAKLYLQAVLSELNITSWVVPVTEVGQIPEDYKALVAPFESTRLAAIVIGDNETIGYIGEFNAGVIRGLKLPDFAAGFELSLSRLVGKSSSTPTYTKMSKYPSVEQDICFKVDNGVAFEAIINLVFEEFKGFGDGIELSPIQALDIFQRPEDTAHKQITFRLSVVNQNRTMTDAEVNLLLDKVSAVAKEKLNAERI